MRLWAKLGIKNILATADGNVAVDNIAMGLAKAGVNVVRIGRPEKVSALIENITLDSLVLKRKKQAKEDGVRAAAAAAAKAREAHAGKVAKMVEEMRESLTPLSLQEVQAEEQKQMDASSDKELASRQEQQRALVLSGCEARPELNGRYVRLGMHESKSKGKAPANAANAQARHVYVKEDAKEVAKAQQEVAQHEDGKEEGTSAGHAGARSAGAEEEEEEEEQGLPAPRTRVFCFFAEIKGREGWYLAERKGSGSEMARKCSSKGILGFCPRKDEVPPKTGWQLKLGKASVADAAAFALEVETKQKVCPSSQRAYAPACV